MACFTVRVLSFFVSRPDDGISSVCEVGEDEAKGEAKKAKRARIEEGDAGLPGRGSGVAQSAQAKGAERGARGRRRADRGGVHGVSGRAVSACVRRPSWGKLRGGAP